MGPKELEVQKLLEHQCIDTLESDRIWIQSAGRKEEFDNKAKENDAMMIALSKKPMEKEKMEIEKESLQARESRESTSGNPLETFKNRLISEFGLTEHSIKNFEGVDLKYKDKLVIALIAPTKEMLFKTHREDYEFNGVKHYFKVKTQEDVEKEYLGVKDWFVMHNIALPNGNN